MPRPVTALVIDDEPHVVVLLKAILKQLGMETVWDASDGVAGLEKASSMKPQVVLLDLNLPKVDGLAILATLKERHPDLPVIIVSAQSTMRTINRARELGAVSYVLKHAPKSEVMQTLSDAFDAIAEKSGGEAAVEGETPADPV